MTMASVFTPEKMHEVLEALGEVEQLFIEAFVTSGGNLEQAAAESNISTKCAMGLLKKDEIAAMINQRLVDFTSDMRRRSHLSFVNKINTIESLIGRGVNDLMNSSVPIPGNITVKLIEHHSQLMRHTGPQTIMMADASPEQESIDQGILTIIQDMGESLTDGEDT